MNENDFRLAVALAQQTSEASKRLEDLLRVGLEEEYEANGPLRGCSQVVNAALDAAGRAHGAAEQAHEALKDHLDVVRSVNAALARATGEEGR